VGVVTTIMCLSLVRSTEVNSTVPFTLLERGTHGKAR
jgi:hypothetical protein